MSKLLKSASGVLHFFARGVFYCLFLMPVLAFSQENILAVVSSSGKIYQDFLTEFEKNLNENIKVSKINASELNDNIINNHTIILSIGYKAATSLSKYKINSNIIYSLIPENESVLEKIACNDKCYKVYINQPVERYVKLFKVIFPKNKKLVLATTGESSKKFWKIKSSSAGSGIVFKNIKIDKNQNVARELINELKSDDVLVALPDPYLYNVNTAKSVILTTYHANVPIIAYSKSFAKAGALISLYSSIDNVAVKAASVVDDIYTNSFSEQKEYYPDEFMLEINYSVARSLNINIESEKNIMRKVK